MRRLAEAVTDLFRADSPHQTKSAPDTVDLRDLAQGSGNFTQGEHVEFEKAYQLFRDMLWGSNRLARRQPRWTRCGPTQD